MWRKLMIQAIQVPPGLAMDSLIEHERLFILMEKF